MICDSLSLDYSEPNLKVFPFFCFVIWCVCVCACVRARMRTCVCLRVCSCACMCACVCAPCVWLTYSRKIYRLKKTHDSSGFSATGWRGTVGGRGWGGAYFYVCGTLCLGVRVQSKISETLLSNEEIFLIPRSFSLASVDLTGHKTPTYSLLSQYMQRMWYRSVLSDGS